MEITIREKNDGPTVAIKKNNEEVMNSAKPPVAAAPEVAAAPAADEGIKKVN